MAAARNATRGRCSSSARHARAAYEQYARNDLEPRDDDATLLAVGDAIDPNVFEPVEPAVALAPWRWTNDG